MFAYRIAKKFCSGIVFHLFEKGAIKITGEEKASGRKCFIGECLSVCVVFTESFVKLITWSTSDSWTCSCKQRDWKKSRINTKYCYARFYDSGVTFPILRCIPVFEVINFHLACLFGFISTSLIPFTLVEEINVSNTAKNEYYPNRRGCEGTSSLFPSWQKSEW